VNACPKKTLSPKIKALVVESPSHSQAKYGQGRICNTQFRQGERPETAKAVSRSKERKQMGMGYLNETKYYQMNDNEEPL